MRKQITILLLTIAVSVWGQAPDGYYDDAEGLTGYQLKTALKEIIDGHIDKGYDYLYTIYEDSDSDYYYENDGTVLDMYSEKPNEADAYNYHHQQETCGTYHNEGDCYNREHIVPQSIFNSASPMKSDAHFVVPTDGYVNNRRSSYPFGEVSNPTWTSTNGSKLGTNSTDGYSGTVFEPIDEFKGDIARMLFYVATRYEDEIAGWGDTDMFDGTSDHVFSDWFLEILLSWHNQDPVSQREIDRNNAVYSYQENRNPFIDHPGWVAEIWDTSPDTEAPTIPANLSFVSITDTSMSITWDASTDDRGVDEYLIYVDGTQVATTSTTNYTISGLESATTYQVCVKARDVSGNTSDCSNTITGTTLNAIFSENFDNCFGQFKAVSEASDKNWTCETQYGEDDSACVQMNGYQQDEESKDWLITTSPFNFDEYDDEELSFYAAYQYGETPLEVVYSADYDGGDYPSNFTWTEVPNVNLPTPDGSTDRTDYRVDNADLSSVQGSVYIAFKYFTEGKAPTRWTIDSFKIYASETTAVNAENKEVVTIYPNPLNAPKVLQISMPGNAYNTQIYISDLSGKQIFEKTFNTTKTSIDLYFIPKGIYFVNVQSKVGTHFLKLIIE